MNRNLKKFLAVITSLTLVALGALVILPSTHFSQPVHAQQYATCQVTGATPLVCGSACSGIVTIAASAQLVVVNTSCVAANSRILLTYDDSFGTLLSVTCNTTAQLPYVDARVTGVSFSIKTGSTFTTNPGCFSFRIDN